MSHNDVVSKVGFELLTHFASHGSEEMQQDAQIKLATMQEIKKEERERFKDSLARDLAKLPNSLQTKIARGGFTLDVIIDNFEVFRNCLHFDSKVLLPRYNEELLIERKRKAAVAKAQELIKQREE